MQGQSLTTASDLSQLGAVALEVLVGRPLRDGNDGESSAPRQRARTFDTATAATRGTALALFPLALRGGIDAILTTALRPQPEARYPSAGEMAADLRAWLTAQPVATRGAPLRDTAAAAGAPLPAGFASLRLLAVIAIGVASLVHGQRVREEARIAHGVSALLSSMHAAGQA